MDIILSGSIAYDYLMRFPGRFTDHFIAEDLHRVSLSFLVEDMTKHWGGVAANIAYTLALLGARPKLMGTVGRDFGDYRQWLETVGVDCSTVRQYDDVFTASFFANTDLENNQIASFYAGAMTRAREVGLGDVFSGKPDLVVISPNDPLAMSRLAQECRDHNVRFIYDPSQQVPRLSGDELRRDMQGAYVMIVNAYEAGIICSKTGYTLDDLRAIVDVLIITNGKQGATIYDGANVLEVPVFPEAFMREPTGVGDAFRAGLIRGITLGFDWYLSGLMGSLCATYVIEQTGTQNHRFTVPEFVERFRTAFDDRGELDRLMAAVSP